MNIAEYHITFRAPILGTLQVGDELIISGKATVRSITADLVDITAIGADPQYALGEATIELVSNHASVKRP